MSASANTRPPPAGGPHSQATRRLLIFQETRNPQNVAETVYLPVNKLGLPICGDGPEMPSILELPLRVLRVFTDIFNQPKYKGWYVLILILDLISFYIWLLFDIHVLELKVEVRSYANFAFVVGPSSLQVPTVIFRKKGNFMLWFWSRRRIRCMHRMRLIWGLLELDLVFFFFLFLSYVCGIPVECCFFLFFCTFLSCYIVSVFNLLWYSLYGVNVYIWSKYIQVFTG